MTLDMECEFRDRGSIPRECQKSHDVDLMRVNFTIALVASFLISNTLLRRFSSLNTYKYNTMVHKIIK